MIAIRESSKAALCGIISALAVVVMLTTYISPFLVYTAPAFSGLLLLLILNEVGYGWTIGSYFTISALSVFLIADKEAAVFFSMFFGYYPILAYFFMTRISRKSVAWLLKVPVFNISCLISLLVCFYVFGIGFEDLYSEGIDYTIIFVILLNVFFVVYDILILRLQELYVKKFRKRFRKLFNIR